MDYSSRNNFMYTLLMRKETVFSLTDIAMVMNEDNPDILYSRMRTGVKNGLFLNLRKGIYAKPGYSPLEMACKIYTPSYLSLEYILQRDGIIFQYDSTITMVSYLSREIEVDGHIIKYRKIKGPIMISQDGIIRRNFINEATKERAFLDLLYLSPNYYLDNLSGLDRKELDRLLPLYNSKTLYNRVKNLFDNV